MARTIVIAPDSFKGTIGAADAATALAAGWHSVAPGDTVRLLPMADGGEGTVDAFAAAVPGAQRVPVRVIGPEDAAVETSWLLLPPTSEAPAGTAVVELASTSGIELLGTPPRLRALDAHTYGFGQAIAAALAHGVSRLVLGIGSSASTDGGLGMLVALGARVTDAAGNPVALGGRGLAQASAVDLTGLAALPLGGVQVLTDVTNPLLGARGAATVFAPQKGATPEDVAALDAALERWAGLVGAVAGAGAGAGAGDGAAGAGDGAAGAAAGVARADATTPGAGAAGGTGFGLLAWGARLVPGSDAVADLIGLADVVAAADVVVTGEGSYDGQSAAGKVPAHVASLAARGQARAALVAGRIAPDADTTAFAATASLTELAGSAEQAMADPARWLEAAGGALARALA